MLFCEHRFERCFFSIPVKESDRKYLRFTWKGTLYQFTCLAQGLSTCPRVFTKIMKCVFSDLRKKGHCNTGYIDDSLLIGQSYDDIRDTVALVDSLGFTIHTKKIRFHFDSRNTLFGFYSELS